MSCRARPNASYSYIVDARSTDGLAFSSPSLLTGTGATAVFTYTLDGIFSGLSAFGSGGANAVRACVDGISKSTGQIIFDSGAPTVSTTLSFNIPITFGTGSAPYQVELQAIVNSSLSSGDLEAANFFNTLQLRGIAVYLGGPGPGSTQVTDFNITADSGAEYTSNGVVPEPSTEVLCFLGLASATWLLSRRRRSADQ